MPTSQRVAAARLRRAQLRDIRSSIDAAVSELDRCQMALFGASGAIAAGMHTDMLDSDGAYELLHSIYNRQAIAIVQLRKALAARQGRV